MAAVSEKNKHTDKDKKLRRRYEYVLQKMFLYNFLQVMRERSIPKQEEILIIEPVTEFRRFIASEFMESDLLK
jgi:hypothetical protein